jgi:hypothetical protein
VTQIAQLTPDLIRRFMLGLSETHNEGGLHACIDSGAPALPAISQALEPEMSYLYIRSMASSVIAARLL